jgi:hypothetical protein
MYGLVEPPAETLYLEGIDLQQDHLKPHFLGVFPGRDGIEDECHWQ